MTFLSLNFALFGCLVFAAFWGLPGRFRPGVLALANLWFALCFGPKALVALAAISLAGWAAGLWLNKGGKKTALVVGILLCALPLLTYKYWPLAATALGLGSPFMIISPIGISFYVFKSIDYLVQVYKGSIPAETNVLHYFNYTGFFAQLASGPIQPAASLLPQLKNTAAPFERRLAYLGCVRFCWGLFLKQCLADQFAGYQAALRTPEHYYGLSILWSLLGYSLQLYFDFASYSHMAIGLANLLGISTEENFISPYFSRSIGEFWRRWHISLSTFLRNYIYIPLGGSRRGTLRLVLATMVTFLVSGMWHGATDGFVVWGALQGLYLLAGRLSRPVRTKVWAALGQKESSPLRSVIAAGFTFCLVVFVWLFFYTGSLSAALPLLHRMLSPFPLSVHYIKESIVQLGYTPIVMARLGLFTTLAALVDWCGRKKGFGAWAAGQKPWVLISLCYACLFFSLFWGASGALPNIYFAF